MAMSVHCGSPQIAFRLIPCPMLATARKGHASFHSSSTSKLSLQEVCFYEELRSSLRQDRKAGPSRQLIECRRLHFYGYGLLPPSFSDERGSRSARISSLEDFKETDHEGEHRFKEEELFSSNSKDASSSKESLEIQHLKELIDAKENELQSVRNAIRAVERENESLQENCERVSNELRELKLEKNKISISEPTPSSFSSGFVAAEQQKIRKGVSSSRKEEERSSLIATDELRISSSAALLKVGAIDSFDRVVNSSEDGDNYPQHRFTDEITSIKITSINSNTLNVKAIKDYSVPDAHDQKQDENVMGVLKAITKERKASDLDPLESAESQPWPEWTAFLSHLKKHEYFSSDCEDNSFEEDGGVKKAIMKFGRDRDDIFESFSKNHLKVLARFGCPSTDRKVVNAGKRLRGHFEISESNVCQQCSLKTTCTRAYSDSGAGAAVTIDVVRLLMQFSLNPGGPADAKLSLPTQVKHSISNLLVQAVELSKVPRDPNLQRPEIRESFTRPVEGRNKLKAGIEQIEMKPGNWRCSECHYVNFSKNRHCRECSASRPPQELRPGDWECPKCQYVNYSRNMECRDCHAERPRRSSSQKDRYIDSGVRRARFSRERQAFVHGDRDDRRYPSPSGDFSGSIGGTCPKREEWKLDLNKAKQKLDNGFDADASEKAALGGWRFGA